MKIGFASRYDPLDKKSWSGSVHYTYMALCRHYDVEVFGYKWPWWLREWLTMQKSLNRKFSHKGTAVEFLKAYAKDCSRQLEKQLKQNPVDLLFVSGSPQMISYLRSPVPVIFMIDATFKQLNGYYPYYSNLPAYNVKQGVELDRLAFQNASHCLLTSEWAKASAVNDYQISADKISVIPFSPNMEESGLIQIVPSLPNVCRLLFLGVEWERKGGPIVLESFRLLQQMGLNPSLHIIGVVPPDDLSGDKNITVIPFLDKNNPAERVEMVKIMEASDILFVPTRAECAGVVFSEASAFGLPSVSTDTGGVSSMVHEGINGYLLPPEAQAPAYAEKIASIFREPGKLDALKQSSLDYYKTQLTWTHWEESFQAIVRKLLP